MKIKNDLVRIKVGKKKYDFHNLILNEYLRRFALGQTSSENAVVLKFSQRRDVGYILLKFDTPISELNENSELSNYDFDICIINRAKYSQNLSEKNVIVQYSYEFKENDSVLDEVIASQGGDSSTVIKHLKEFYGRKIMAIGFTGHWWYKDSTPVCAVLDTSNYNIYLEENQEFSITRRDIITTDAEFYSNDKDKVPTPVHLAPYGVPQIINQPDIVDSEGAINSFYNNAYGALYSIGKGYVPNVIEEEKIIGEDAKVVNNGTSLTISSVENEDVGTEALYPSDDLYPIGKFTEEIQTSEKGVQVSIEGNGEDAFVKTNGKSTQATRSGKNLLENIAKSQTINGVTFTVNEDGTVTANGTATAQVALSVTSFLPLPVGQYIFSGCPTSGTTQTHFVQIRRRNPDQHLNDVGQGNTFSITDNTQSVDYYIVVRNGVTVNNVLFKPMIRLASVSDDTYEQYGASPLPEFPSEIKSVGDEGTVTIEQRGKNYLNVPSDYILKGNQTINLNLPAGNYLINWEDITTDGTDKNMLLQFFYEDETSYARYISTTYTSKQLELKATQKIIRVNIYSQSGYNVSKDITTTFKKLMISKDGGSYEPYFSKDYVLPLSAPLISLPNGTKDTIEEDGIHRRVGKKVFNGSDEDIIYHSQTTSGLYRYYLYVSDLAFGYKKVISNYFKQNDETTYSEVKEVCINSHPTSRAINFFTEFASVEEFKIWLSTHNTEVNYELSEEVVEPFTDEQLEVINSIETQKGTNIFSIDSELEPEIEVTEYKSPLYPIKDNYKYIILKYKVWQEVVTGEYTEEDGYIQEITDTGYYYHQAIPLEEYGTLNTTIKYERG